MTVNSIGGLNIVNESRSGGGLSSITVDVGVLASTSAVVTKSCSATITMGPLASVISGISGTHTWGATFQMQFSGLPSSGGGTLTPEQLAKIQGYEGVGSAQDAQDAALAALGDEGAAPSPEDAAAAEADQAAEALAEGDVLGAAEHALASAANAVAANPLPLILGILIGAAVAGGVGFGVSRRKKKAGE